MVKDASSGNGRRLPLVGDAGANYASKLPQGSPSNLTQELAQLLAASIAQNHANRIISSGMPSNAELTSLAHLVSAASEQRTLAPVFKDGLSALSYARPQSRQALNDAVEPDLPPDDEPMPIPSTWREPARSDDQRWYRQQMGAAFLGLIAGLMIVVPSVLWLSGRIGPLKLGAPAVRQLAVAGEMVPEIKTLRVQVRPVEKQVENAVQYIASSDDGHTQQPIEQASVT